MSATPRLLLTTVCQPYGVRTADAEAAGMQMELFNNQVTREQGVHSPRANFWTFPLYLLAENIRVSTVVLDFPRWRDFVRELRRGYTHVGLSFIQCNVLKAKRMAEYIRRHHPQVQILLGGYGTALPDLKTLVPHDAACPGEGVRWLRDYFGEPPNQPIRHPILHSLARHHIYGYPCFVQDTAVLIPGLGCRKGCFFCATSSKFGHHYLPILKSGRDVFEVCREAEENLGVTEFAVIDENFLQEPERARELLSLMESHGKTYKFFLFASADNIQRLGVDFMVRLGAAVVWIGIEARRSLFAKTHDVDVKRLVRQLQDHGVSVLSSSILFLEDHDRERLDQDVNWAIGVRSDLHQFMQLTPLPGTPLYRKYEQAGRLIPSFPYTKMSGQNVLNFYHPHFTPEEAGEITREAFRRKYERHGPAVMNMALTALKGYGRARAAAEMNRRQGLVWHPGQLRYLPGHGGNDDAFLDLRAVELEHRAREKRVGLWASMVFAPNRRVRHRARRIERLFEQSFGPMTARERAEAALLVALAGVEAWRRRVARWRGHEDMVRQPPVRRVAYRM